MRLLLPNLWMAFALTLLVGTPAANAHTVWVQRNADQLVLRFAEPPGDFETSPGHLDGLSGLTAFSVTTNVPVAVDALKRSDHFLLAGARATNPACAEAAFTVRNGRKPMFYARWQPAGAGAATPQLTLDLVPTGKPGEARAYFRGKPLPGIKAMLRTPAAKEIELTADANGLLRFQAAAPGSYLLTVAHHRESLAGFHLGRPYEQTSHNCSLAWVQP